MRPTRLHGAPMPGGALAKALDSRMPARPTASTASPKMRLMAGSSDERPGPHSARSTPPCPGPRKDYPRAPRGPAESGNATRSKDRSDARLRGGGKVFAISKVSSADFQEVAQELRPFKR